MSRARLLERLIMTDEELVATLRQLERTRRQMDALIAKIENSDHVYGEMAARNLYEQCWFAAWPEAVCFADLEHPENWELRDSRIYKRRKRSTKR